MAEFFVNRLAIHGTAPVAVLLAAASMRSLWLQLFTIGFVGRCCLRLR